MGGAGEAVHADDYLFIGRVTEFRHGMNLGDVIRRHNDQRLSYLRNYGERWAQLRSRDALVFTDNHDTQRGVLGFNSVLTFFDANMYKIANAFQLAWPYGHVRIMSSYYWPRRIVAGQDLVCSTRHVFFFSLLLRNLSSREFQLRGMSTLHDFQMAIFPCCWRLPSHGRARW